MKRCELLFGIGLAAVAAPLYTRVAQAWGIALIPQVKNCQVGVNQVKLTMPLLGILQLMFVND